MFRFCIWALAKSLMEIARSKSNFFKKNFVQRTLQFLLQLNFVFAAALELEAGVRPEILFPLVRLLIHGCWMIVLEQRSLWANEKK
jgi:hypothetical protein